MRVSWGLITRNEEQFLPYVLPIMKDSFDEIVAVDAESTDRTVEILRDHGVQVHTRPWMHDFSGARNYLISKTKSDWTFQLDADECMFPEDLDKVKSRLGQATLVVLPRIELVNDMDHWDPKVYPGYQGRIFHKGMGYEFRGRVHEALFAPHASRSLMVAGLGMTLDMHIYHYGQLKSVEECWLRHHNYGAIAGGQYPVLQEVPKGMKLPERPSGEPYNGVHPLKDYWPSGTVPPGGRALGRP